MKLSATPFHPVTGELLPAYRDAYLRGDLSSQNTQLVDAYLQANKTLADDTLRRFYEMKKTGHQVRPVGWVQRQFELLRTEPQRFRRRAATLVAGGALLGSAVFAGTNLPTDNTRYELPATPTETAEAASSASAAGAMRMVSVRGRILDENGRPLIGATVLHKGTRTGVSTDAEGNYLLRIPANQKPTLQYAYAGYAEEELHVKAGATENVTLVPRTTERASAKKRWLFF
ncbi:carboxypeptidase-like regulatory domain-containing protein [Hymenobacter sp. B81]|uniref:carboxypeptidase-like regulatory domain-containing protein n=1 Tax=Hymenobacter sp. B81 TaxID=3344878 RepID=UPI0037DCB74F